MASSKHLLLVGGQNHPLTPLIYKRFSLNWRILHMGYFNNEFNWAPHKMINLNDITNNSMQDSAKMLSEVEN